MTPSRSRRFLRAVCTAGVLAVPVAAAAQRPARSPNMALTARLPVDTAVRMGTLPNGLRYYVRRNAKPEKRAELRLVIHAGSLQEDADQRGLAHFLEHMAFNGTRHFAKNDIVKYLESIGVRFGADLNAETGFDQTVYILPVPTDSAGILERSLRFLGDVASGLLLDSADVVAERGVVLAEWRTGLGATERVQQQQVPIMMYGSRYAERLPIGRPADIEQAMPAPIRRYWRDWYRPDLMAVVAVGDADPGELIRLITKTFAPIPRRTGARPRVISTLPRHDSTLVSIATDPELTTSKVSVLWKRPARVTRTVGDLRQQLIADLYRTMINQRLNELAQRPTTTFVGAWASGGRFVTSADFAGLDIMAKEGQLLPALQAVLTEDARVRQHGFLPSELERARTNLLRGYEMAFAEREKRPSAAYVEEYISHFIDGDAIPGVAYASTVAQAVLPGITLAEVNRFGATDSGVANRVVTVSMPRKEGLTVPAETNIRRVFAVVDTAPLTPWVETVADGALAPTPPVAGRVVATTRDSALGITTWTLSNGVRVVVKPTDFTADQVLMSGWRTGGVSQVPDSAVLRAALATTVVERGGVGSFSLIDLNKKLTGKVAAVSAFIADQSEGFSGRASPKDLETLLQLTWLRMTAPRADSVAVQALLQQFEAVLKNKEANPAALFSDTIQLTLAGGHPRVRPLSVASLAQLQLAPMLALYRDRVGDAGDFTFLFVGNVELATLQPLVAQWLGALPTTRRAQAVRDVGPPLFHGQIEKTVRKGLAPQSQTAIVMAGTAPWSREEAYLLSSVGELLEMRLTDRLRESLGGTYSVSVNTALSRVPRQEWQVVISYGSAPERADAMFAAVRQELDSLRRVPPSAAEVTRITEQQRREREVARKQNGWWIGTLQDRLLHGDPLSTVFADDALIAALTAERVQAAAQRYLNETNRARFVLLPEK